MEGQVTTQKNQALMDNLALAYSATKPTVLIGKNCAYALNLITLRSSAQPVTIQVFFPFFFIWLYAQPEYHFNSLALKIKFFIL